MNIKYEKVPGLLQEVTFEINKEDYAENLRKALNKQQRSANVPGFRPGCAPMGMIKRMFEKQLLVQEVDQLVNTSMDQFMKDNNVKFIFEPLPVEGKSVVDFEKPDHFEFVYEYSLAPEVELDYAKLPKVVDFKVIPTAEERENFIKSLRERHGNYVTPETIEATDSLSVKYMDGEEEKDAFFFMRDLNEKAQKSFIGKKMGDEVTLALKDAFTSPMALSRFLKLKEGEQPAADNAYKFKMSIKHIGRIELAELNEEFFKKAYPDGNITTEADLNAEADRVIIEQYKPELDRQFMNDAIEMLIDNVAMELPDDFIKRYILLTQKDMTPETLEEKYKDYQRAFKWQIIEGKIVEGNDVNVGMDDVKNYFREYFVKNYFGNFNAEDVKDRVDQLVNEAVANKEYVKSVYDLLFDQKLTELLRSKLNIDHKEGDVKAFVDMLTARTQKDAAPAEKKAPAKKKAAAKKTEEPAAEETEAKPKKTRAKSTKKTTEETK
ncbi:MAG: hypothetical protein MJZ57_05235 [Bacteroidales bacterium]|nr:hypothetical protein [Bacteroidales bacterium]